MPPFTYKDLDVWKQATDLVEACYRATASFPAAEVYGLSSQLRRAAVSIPSNIAEGHCRKSTRAYLNHISIALGSHAEVETCIEISSRLGLLRPTERTSLTNISDAVGRMLNGLHSALEQRLEGHR